MKRTWRGDEPYWRGDALARSGLLATAGLQVGVLVFFPTHYSVVNAVVAAVLVVEALVLPYSSYYGADW